MVEDIEFQQELLGNLRTHLHLQDQLHNDSKIVDSARREKAELEEHMMNTQKTKNGAVEKYHWARMTSLKLGRYAEHFVCIELLTLNFDVYFSDLDDHGIDLLIR